MALLRIKDYGGAADATATQNDEEVTEHDDNNEDGTGHDNADAVAAEDEDAVEDAASNADGDDADGENDLCLSLILLVDVRAFTHLAKKIAICAFDY